MCLVACQSLHPLCTHSHVHTPIRVFSNSEFQWLLMTLTAGTGGSLLCVGSAAGVGLAGIAGGVSVLMRVCVRLSVCVLFSFSFSLGVSRHFWGTNVVLHVVFLLIPGRLSLINVTPLTSVLCPLLR